MKQATQLAAVCVAVLIAAGQVQAGQITFDPSPTIFNSGGKLVSGSQNFTDGGFYVEAFTAVQGSFGAAHFHIASDTGNSGNAERQHFNGSGNLQGFFYRELRW